MRLFLTLLPVLLFLTVCHNANCQAVANYNQMESMNDSRELMSDSQLSHYRQSIWDTLPAAVGWINDFEGLFKVEEEDTLESIIQHFEKETSIEIMIVTVDTNMVAKDKFTDFADRLLKIWGIGKKLKKNGIVICISSGYQEIKISSDVGIEKLMNEKKKLQILKQFFIPYYEQKKYYGGTLSGLNELLITFRENLPI